MSSCARVRPGPSSRSSWTRTEATISSAPRSRSPETRRWWGRAHQSLTSAGSAYVFVRTGTTWTEQQKLVASDGGDGDTSASRSRSRATRPWSGRIQDDTPASPTRARPTCSCARARPGPSSRSSLASDGAADDLFGVSVALSGDTAVVGAHATTTRAAWTRARPTCSCAAGRPGPSSRSSWPRDGAAATPSATRSSSRGTRRWSGRPDDTPGGMDAGSAYVFVRSGTTWTEQQKLLASDGPADDLFGISVAVSGRHGRGRSLLDDDAAASDAGAAYVFVRSGTTWTEQQKLMASRRGGGRLLRLVGRRSRATRRWSARPATTRRAAWMRARPTSSCARGRPGPSSRSSWPRDGAAGDVFGFSVSISGRHGGGRGATATTPRAAWTRARPTCSCARGRPGPSSRSSWPPTEPRATTSAVRWRSRGTRRWSGAYATTPGGADAGSAYVFVRTGTTWTEQQKLLASDGAAGDLFGISVVDLRRHRGGRGRTTTTPPAARMRARPTCSCARGRPGPSSRSSWPRTAPRTTSSALGGGLRGHRVVGAVEDDTPGGADAGSAYVFVRSGTTWTEQQKLLALGRAADDFFGISVSVSGDTVGRRRLSRRHPGRQDAGSAYVFVRSGTTWTEQQKLLAPDGRASDLFGGSVSVSGDTAVVGASFDDTPAGADAGSAYVFVRSGTTWTEQQKLLAPDGAAGDNFGGVGFGLRGRTAGGRTGPTARVRARLPRATADLAVTKTDGQTTAVPGRPSPTRSWSRTPVPTRGRRAVTDPCRRRCWARPGPACPRAARAARRAAPATSRTSWTCPWAGRDLHRHGHGGSGATGTLVNTATVAPPAGAAIPTPRTTAPPTPTRSHRRPTSASRRRPRPIRLSRARR